MGLLGSRNSLRRNLLALLVALPWLLVVVIRVFALDRWWLGILLVSFAPQVLFTMVVPLAIGLVFRAWTAAAGVAVAGLVLGAIVLPRAVAADQPVITREARRVTILTANLLHGDASDAALINAVRESDPDIIALQEVTPKNVAALRAAGELRKRPYLNGNVVRGTLGIATISRWPLVPVPGSGLVDGKFGELKVIGSPIVFRNVHPTPPVLPDAVEPWERNLALIPPPDGRLRVVVGDFNATLDHRAFRSVLGRGYIDAGRVTGNGLEWTWSAGKIRRLVIDHVLYPADAQIRATSYRTFNLPGSDHNAIAVTLNLPLARQSR